VSGRKRNFKNNIVIFIFLAYLSGCVWKNIPSKKPETVKNTIADIMQETL